MANSRALLLLFGFAALSLFAMQTASAKFYTPSIPENTPPDLTGDPPTGDYPPGDTLSLDTKINALLALIRRYESGDDYSIINGGAHFSSFADHPGIIVPPGTSTAAGAYQITYGTWQQFGFDLLDFSPENQYQAAYRILESTGAVDYLVAGDYAGAIRAAGKRWQALKVNPIGTLLAAYTDYLDYA